MDFIQRQTLREAKNMIDSLQPDDGQFSLSRVFASMCKGGAGLWKTPEGKFFRTLAEDSGREFDPQRIEIPLLSLRSQRAMASTPGAKGGYAIGTETLDPVDALRPWSMTASAGLTILEGLTSNVPIPRTKTKSTSAWQSTDGTTMTPSDPVLDQNSLTAKTAIAVIQFSKQFLVQSPQADAFIE